jgi:hypothetical protein
VTWRESVAAVTWQKSGTAATWRELVVAICIHRWQRRAPTSLDEGRGGSGRRGMSVGVGDVACRWASVLAMSTPSLGPCGHSRGRQRRRRRGPAGGMDVAVVGEGEVALLVGVGVGDERALA